MKYLLFVSLLGVCSSLFAQINLDLVPSEKMKSFIEENGERPSDYVPDCHTEDGCRTLFQLKEHSQCYGFPLERDELFDRFVGLNPAEVWRGPFEFQFLYDPATSINHYKNQRFPKLEAGQRLFITMKPRIIAPKAVLVNGPVPSANLMLDLMLRKKRYLLRLPGELPVVFYFNKVDSRKKVIQLTSAIQNLSTEMQTLSFMAAQINGELMSDYSFICHKTIFNHPSQMAQDGLFVLVHESLLDMFYGNVSQSLGLGRRIFKSH